MRWRVQKRKPDRITGNGSTQESDIRWWSRNWLWDSKWKKNGHRSRLATESKARSATVLIWSHSNELGRGRLRDRKRGQTRPFSHVKTSAMGLVTRRRLTGSLRRTPCQHWRPQSRFRFGAPTSPSSVVNILKEGPCSSLFTNFLTSDTEQRIILNTGCLPVWAIHPWK